MNDAEFHQKLREHRAHLAAVPLALQALRNVVTDFDGSDMADAAQPRDGLTCGQLRTIAREVERLRDQVQQLHKDRSEAEREFQREARDIAAEARWEGQEETRGGHY